MVLPVRGKVFGGQAYEVYDGKFWSTVGRYVRQAGLAVQLGLALDHPTEELFTGLATEPLPGLTIAYGQFLTYAEHSTYPSGAFVALTDDASPVRKRWHHEWSSWTFAVDGSVIVSAFGQLLGLK
jgi:hypothetical protein